MESNIVAKIKMLNFSNEIQPTINKFVASISDAVVSKDCATDYINWLAGKGIVIKRPSQMKALAVAAPGRDFKKALAKVEEIKGVVRNGGTVDAVEIPEELKELVDTINRVELMERSGDLKIYAEDPVRINYKGLPERLDYLKSHGETYKSPEGKYSKLLFQKREFEKKYGVEYLKEHEISVEPEINAPVIDEEKQKVTEIISAPLKEETVAPAGLVANVTEPDDFKGLVNEILSKPQTIALNDVAFDRYLRLEESIKNVMITVYGINEVSETIINNLIKLVTAEFGDDQKVIFASITYGKTLSPEEEQKILNAIDEELSYTGIMDLNLGGMAA